MKAKTHRGTAKRFRVTRNGKVMVRRANRNHLLGKKSSSRKRRLAKQNSVTAERRNLLRLLRKR